MLSTKICESLSDCNERYYMIEFTVALSATYKIVYDIEKDKLVFWYNKITYIGNIADDFYSTNNIALYINSKFLNSLNVGESIYVYNEVSISNIIPEVILNIIGGYDKLLKEAKKAVIESML